MTLAPTVDSDWVTRRLFVVPDVTVDVEVGLDWQG